MFQAPPLLKFPSLDILRRLTRGILDELLAEENEILQNKRGNLVFKQFGGGLSQKGKRKQKVSNACHHCKKSKVGCDGHYPCDNCIKRSKQCEYPPGVSPPPRPTPVEALPTPTDLPEPSIMSHDPPKQQQQQQPPFAVSRFSAKQEQPQHYFPAPDGSVPLVTENVDSTPSPLQQPQSQQIQQAYTDQYGHFTGDTTFFVPQRESAPVPAQRTTFPQLPPSPQFLSYDIQISLIDTFYMHANPFFPAIMNKAQMRQELDLLRTDQQTNFSQLFFHALFSRAASLTSGEEFVQNTTTWSSVSDVLLNNAFQYRDAYLDFPHFSTLLALVIVANHLEHKKLAKNLRKAWMLIGDAGRLAIDMGLHRASRVLLLPDGQDDPQTQMCIRTFWAVCVSERTMSITYGRPSMFDDKDIDIPPPKCIPSDDDDTKTWVESLRQFVIMSNIACRIMRFNYSAQAQFPGAFRSNAAVTSVDNWMCSESNDLEERLPQSIDCSDTKKRLNILEALYFLSNLIQSHKPYMQLDAGTKSFSARPSFEICYLTAIMISHITHTMPITELADLCKSPPTLYTIVKALQVHLENATHSESERIVAFSEISFERTMTKLWILPTINRQKDDSMLTETLHYLEQKYYQRTNIVVGGHHTPSHCADSPVPTLCSNGTSAMSISSAEGTPPCGSVQGPIPTSNIQSSYDRSPITFVSVHPQGKASLGKRRSREPSKRIPPKAPPQKSQNNNPEPPSFSTTTSTTTDIHIPHHQVQENQQSYNFIPSINTSTNIGYNQQQMTQEQQSIEQQQQQQQLMHNQIIFQQQMLNDDQHIMQAEMNAAISAGFDVRSVFYPGSHLMPPTPVEQDPDLPSLILNDESWNLHNNYTS